MVLRNITQKLHLCDPEPSLRTVEGYTLLNTSTNPGGRCSLSSETVFASKSGRTTFTSDPSNHSRIVVRHDSEHICTISKLANRVHCWEVRDLEDKVIAQFRASRAFSWLVLIGKSGAQTVVHQNQVCGFGRTEWQLARNQYVRWTRSSGSMLLVQNSKTVLPSVAELERMSRLSLQTDCEVECQVRWRRGCQPLLQLDRHMETALVVSTAFISMWKWSREPATLGKLRERMDAALTRWVATNLSVDQLHALLKTTIAKH